MPRQSTLLALIPLALLTTVALAQNWLAASIDLTPWKGGGFGMFSTVDHRPNRFIRTFVMRRREDGKLEEIPVPLPSLPTEMKETTRLVRSAPGNTKALEQLAHQLAATSWRRADHPKGDPRSLGTEMAKTALSTTAHFIVASASDFDKNTKTIPVIVDSIRVEAWKLGYDGDRQKLTTRLVNQATVALRAAPRAL